MNDPTFTEHDEVIVSVSKLRDIIRTAYEQGVIAGRFDSTTPAIWLAETYLKSEEEQLREVGP
jgi:hypothetical protein